MKKQFYLCLQLTVILFLTNCENRADKKTILFVGNSLTYQNDLPGIVKSIAGTYHVNLEVTTLGLADYSLADHWVDGDLQKLVSGGKYDYVIVQQGPSSQPYGRGILLEYGNKIAKLCTENNVRLGFYMVWPARANYFTYTGVIESYTMAASETNAILCPAGAVWKNYMEKNNDFSLYGWDQFHPSKAGSFLAALVIFHSLFPEYELAEVPHAIFHVYIRDEVQYRKMIRQIIQL